MGNNKGRIKKIAIVISGLFFLFTSAFAQQMELNDPQIISVVETVNRIGEKYDKIALDKSSDKKVKKFAQAMVDSHTDLFNQTLALEEELILSTQTNVITRSLLKHESENVKLLLSREQEKFNITYVDNVVNLHEEAVSVLKDILIPQARNKKLKKFLAKISPLWEQNLKAAKKMQGEISK